MKYKKFDIDSWNRQEHFQHYRNLQCSFNLTSEIDITNLLQYLKKYDYKFYPTIIYIISKLVNETSEFKMAIKEDEPIIWDILHPAYTIFHKEEKIFSIIWSEYSKEKANFFEEFKKDYNTYKDIKSFSPKKIPENHFNISVIPWINFSGFNLNLPLLGDYFQPIITIGKYTKNKEKVLLPFSIQIHHAVSDGFHVAKFINELQEYCNNPEKI